MDLLHRAGQRCHNRHDAGDPADHPEPRRESGALQMPGDLVAHDVGLLGHLGGKRVITPGGFVDHH